MKLEEILNRKNDAHEKIVTKKTKKMKLEDILNRNVDEEMVKKLLEEEKVMRRKQPEAWTKSKYRIYGLMQQARDKNRKKTSGLKGEELRTQLRKNLKEVKAEQKELEKDGR